MIKIELNENLCTRCQTALIASIIYDNNVMIEIELKETYNHFGSQQDERIIA